LPAGFPAQYLDYLEVDLGVLRPEGRHVAPMKVKFGVQESSTPKSYSFMQNFSVIGAGVGEWNPQNGFLYES